MCALLLFVGGAALSVLWFTKVQSQVIPEVAIDSCSWEQIDGSLSWRCQISNPGFKKWPALKFQLAVWSPDNTWRNLSENFTENLSWRAKQDFSGHSDLGAGIWRLRVAVLDDSGAILAQAWKIWSQTVTSSSTAINPPASWLTAVSYTPPAAGCDPRACFNACLAQLDSSSAPDCLATDPACADLKTTWLRTAGLCYQTCQKQACSFCATETCGRSSPAGENFCQDLDLYNRSRSYQCQPVAGAGACILTQTDQPVEPCSQPVYGDWGEPYCRGNLLLRSRAVQDGYCLSARCRYSSSLDEELLAQCSGGCQEAQCVGNQAPAVDITPDKELPAPTTDQVTVTSATSTSGSLRPLDRWSLFQILIIVILASGLIYFISKQ